MPPLEPGDLLAVMSAGAYGFVMASNYNARPRAAVVLVDGDRFDVVRDRETRRGPDPGRAHPARPELRRRSRAARAFALGSPLRDGHGSRHEDARHRQRLRLRRLPCPRPRRPAALRARRRRPSLRHRLGRPDPHPGVDRRRLPDGDVQRRRQPRRDVRQRHPLRRQVRLRPRPAPQSARDRDRRRRPDARPRRRARRPGRRGDRRHGRAGPRRSADSGRERRPRRRPAARGRRRDLPHHLRLDGQPARGRLSARDRPPRALPDRAALRAPSVLSGARQHRVRGGALAAARSTSASGSAAPARPWRAAPARARPSSRAS